MPSYAMNPGMAVMVENDNHQLKYSRQKRPELFWGVFLKIKIHEENIPLSILETFQPLIDKNQQIKVHKIMM